jgi:hypothetical protein
MLGIEPDKSLFEILCDNLKTAKSALAKIHQDMESINRLAKPSYMSMIEQMERTLEPIRRQQLEISRALEMSEAMARIQEKKQLIISHVNKELEKYWKKVYGKHHAMHI